MRSLIGGGAFLVGAVLAALPAIAQRAGDGTDIAARLRATRTVRRSSVGANDPASIRFTLENASQQPLSALEWDTPLEGIRNDIFAVEHDGRPVAYRGPLVTRGLPTPESYVRLA